MVGWLQMIPKYCACKDMPDVPFCCSMWACMWHAACVMTWERKTTTRNQTQSQLTKHTSRYLWTTTAALIRTSTTSSLCFLPNGCQGSLVFCKILSCQLVWDRVFWGFNNTHDVAWVFKIITNHFISFHIVSWIDQTWPWLQYASINSPVSPVNSSYPNPIISPVPVFSSPPSPSPPSAPCAL